MAAKQDTKKETKKEPKKNKPTRVYKTNYRLVNVLAFAALVAAAVLLCVGPVVRYILVETGGGVILQALNLVAQYCLLAAIAIPGWYFVRGKNKTWKVVYWVMFAIYVLGTVFGVTLGIL